MNVFSYNTIHRRLIAGVHRSCRHGRSPFTDNDDIKREKDGENQIAGEETIREEDEQNQTREERKIKAKKRQARLKSKRGEEVSNIGALDETAAYHSHGPRPMSPHTHLALATPQTAGLAIQSYIICRGGN